MITTSEIVATGKILRNLGEMVVFRPTGTNYELHLKAPDGEIPLDVPVRAQIIAAARKIWTVPSGGNFIAPILGTPRTIQGMVRVLQPNSMIVQAGVPITVEFPADDSAFDLAHGPIAVGTIVNVIAFPGVRIELK